MQHYEVVKLFRRFEGWRYTRVVMMYRIVQDSSWLGYAYWTHIKDLNGLQS